MAGLANMPHRWEIIQTIMNPMKFYSTDVTCYPAPPPVPTSPEYVLAADDGTVTINSLVYPTHPAENRTTDLVLNSSSSIGSIPANYMANLTSVNAILILFYYFIFSDTAADLRGNSSTLTAPSPRLSL